MNKRFLLTAFVAVCFGLPHGTHAAEEYYSKSATNYFINQAISQKIGAWSAAAGNAQELEADLTVIAHALTEPTKPTIQSFVRRYQQAVLARGGNRTWGQKVMQGLLAIFNVYTRSYNKIDI